MNVIGKLFAAMALVVTLWCERLGRFILQALPGYLAPDPDHLVEQYVQAAETAPSAPTVDQRMLNIQSIADALIRKEPPDPELAAGLATTTMQWLAALNVDMLLAVSKSTPAELRAHIKGSKTIRGLLLCEPAGIADFQERVAMETKGPEPESEYYPRWPSIREPIWPAFGPTC